MIASAPHWRLTFPVAQRHGGSEMILPTDLLIQKFV